MAYHNTHHDPHPTPTHAYTYHPSSAWSVPRASDAARPTAWICGYPPPGLDSSASPSIVDTVADVAAASVRAHASR